MLARVTFVPGQKRVVEQPFMIPAATTICTAFFCELETSWKWVVTVTLRRSARARYTAMLPFVTTVLGQKWWVVQPGMTPAAATASIAFS